MHNQQQELPSRSNYWQFSAVAIGSLAVLLWIFFNVSPDGVKDFLLPNSFLPVIVLCWLMLSSGLFVFSLNVRRALLWSSCLVALLWLQLQHILNGWAALYVFSPCIVIELILTFLKRK